MNSTIAELFELEYAYELSVYEKQTNQVKSNELIGFIKLIDHKLYDTSYSVGETLLIKYNDNVDISLFILNWLIISTEKQYNLDLRKKYLHILENFSNKKFSLYAEFLKLYFIGVTYFFDAMLHESESAFNRAINLANQLNYDRGLARCYLHLAYISFDSNKTIQGFHNLNYCYKICVDKNLIKTLSRVQAERMSNDEHFKINNSDAFEYEIYKIKKAIADRDINFARLILANMQKKSRLIYNRRKWTLTQYLVQILILRKKYIFARSVMKSIKDKIIKLSLYQFMQSEKVTFHQEEEVEYIQLKILYQIHECVRNSEKVIKISDISKKSVKLLLETLNQSTDGLSKESICEIVFNIPYDPIVHDSKIYKLILLARKQLGHDFLINEYGAYRLNLIKYKFIS